MRAYSTVMALLMAAVASAAPEPNLFVGPPSFAGGPFGTVDQLLFARPNNWDSSAGQGGAGGAGVFQVRPVRQYFVQPIPDSPNQIQPVIGFTEGNTAGFIGRLFLPLPQLTHYHLSVAVGNPLANQGSFGDLSGFFGGYEIAAAAVGTGGIQIRVGTATGSSQGAGTWQTISLDFTTVSAPPGRAFYNVAFESLNQKGLTFFDNAVLIQPLPGDANFDGTVSFSDFNILAANFGRHGAGLAGGDFDLDGVVDFTDFNILAAHFDGALSPAQTADVLALGQSLAGDPSQQAAVDDFARQFGSVPEPGCLATIALVGGLLIRRRRRT